MKTVNGTFTDTGQSAAITGAKVAIHAQFAGTATVAVQWNINGTWRDIPDYSAKTSSFSYVYDGPKVPLRLSCTAYTNDVTYGMFGE